MAIKLGPVTSRYDGTVRIEQADAAGRQALIRAQARDARGSGTAAATIATAMRPVDGGTLVTVQTDIQISGPAAQFGRGVMQEVSSKLMARFAACLAEEMQAETKPDERAAHGELNVLGALGPNEATPADAAASVGASSRAAAPTVDWNEAALARAPTRPGGYEQTRVGRLPTGPAADAAMAAAAARGAQPARPRRTDDVLDLGEISRGAVLKRALPAVAVIAAAVGVWWAVRARRRR
jgi:hypothetical protein